MGGKLWRPWSSVCHPRASTTRIYQGALMSSLLRRTLVLLAPLLLIGAARAEGLVQLSLDGALSTPGGAPVELHLGFWDGSAVQSVDLRLHLAQRTTGHDLATLLAARLRKAGASFQFPGESTGGSPAQLFLEDTTLVSLRLGHGLHASVTTTQDAPESVRFLAPLEVHEALEVAVCVTTFHPHLKTPGRHRLSVQAQGDTEPSSICEELFTNGLARGLVSDRPAPDRWRPTKTSEGAVVTGCSIDLSLTQADWGLEVQLAVPKAQ